MSKKLCDCLKNTLYGIKVCDECLFTIIKSKIINIAPIYIQEILNDDIEGFDIDFISKNINDDNIHDFISRFPTNRLVYPDCMCEFNFLENFQSLNKFTLKSSNDCKYWKELMKELEYLLNEI